MKRCILFLFAILSFFSLSACDQSVLPTEPAHIPETTAPAATSAPKPTEPEATQPATTEPAVTVPLHSSLYIPNVAVEDVIRYFNEVCLDSEIVHGGDPSVIQKWMEPIYYTLEDSPVMQNLRICFGGSQEMTSVMGPEYQYMDGAVRFWYVDNSIIDSVIFYRSDINQYTRNSVIIEEIYNGLGPVQDTSLRTDSIIFQGYSEPQWLTAIDELILRLLYHPEIKVGMNAAQCEEVIRRLYY